MSASAEARAVSRAFKFQGLQLTGGAMKALISVLSSEADAQAALSAIIIAIKDRLEKSELRSSLIDEAAIGETPQHIA